MGKIKRGAAGYILLSWTLWYAKSSRTVWFSDSEFAKGKKGAIPL